MSRFLRVNDGSELINLTHVMRVYATAPDGGTTIIMSDGSQYSVPENFEYLVKVIALPDKPPAKPVKNKHK